VSFIESEIAETPNILREHRARYYAECVEALGDESFEAVVLVARGSSDHAALFAAYLIEAQAKLPTMLAKPSITTRFGGGVRYPRSLFVGISQSGMSPDIVAVMKEARDAGHATLAITNSPASPLSETANKSVYLGCGVEQSVAATKTYSASLLVCMQLQRAITKRGAVDADALPTDARVEAARSAAKEHARTVCAANVVFALGRGYSFASAKECALKLIECAQIPCLPYSSADFEHGPKALASGESAALLFGETDPGDEAGAIRVRLARASGSPEQALDDALHLQCLAVECARANGLDPDNPENIEKITNTY
jgi:glucosamine--fructose-6-phosphate aminotransferase (isomerizing)